MRYPDGRQEGFTLVELAVVLVIVGVLIGSFITTFANRIETTRVNDTEQELAEIKRLLMAYAYSRGGPPYLPCPDTDIPPDGIENRNGAGDCVAGANVGILPWRDLGYSRADAWGAQYRYWANNDYANDGGFDLSTNNILNSAAVATRVNDAFTVISQNAVAVVFSHGKNGLSGISREGVNRQALPGLGNGYDDEIENMDGDLTYMSRYSTDEGVATVGGAFDDIVVWINAFELKAQMVDAGMLP